MTQVLKGFVEAPHGQVHFRYGGSGPVVVLLHDALRSSVQHVPTIEWLGDHFTVLALDTPGCGGSSPLPQPDPQVADFAAVLAAALEALGVERCALYGIHAGANLALRLATDQPHRVALTILEGLTLAAAPATAAYLERRAREFEPTTDGSHLVRLWRFVLDWQRYGHHQESGARRMLRALPDDIELHEIASDLLSAGPDGMNVGRAIACHAAGDDVRRLRSRVVFLAREDDPFYGELDRLPGSVPAGCSVERIPPQLSAWRTRLLDLLRRGAPATTQWRPPAAPKTTTAAAEQLRYVDLVHGQVRLRLRGHGTATPVLLLHDVPGGARSLSPLAEALAADRRTLTPDLPGLGDSHPLPYPSLGSYVTALQELLEELEVGVVDVVGHGLGTCFAVALAAHRPAAVRRLVLDGLPMIRSRDRHSFARHYCPPLRPDRHGTHLLRYWQQMLDAEASWPWFDRSVAAGRAQAPDIDPQRLQADLVDVSRQLPSYGDAARAALEAAVRDILKSVRQPTLLLDVADDVRYAGARRAARRLVDATVLPRHARPDGRAESLRRFLA